MKTRHLRNDYSRYVPKRSPQKRLEDVVLGADISTDLDSPWFADVTAEVWMVAELRRAEAGIRRLRRQLEQRLGGGQPRHCAKCRQPVTGRPDRLYCSDRCRQAAHRSRHARKLDPGLPGLAPSAIPHVVLSRYVGRPVLARRSGRAGEAPGTRASSPRPCRGEAGERRSAAARPAQQCSKGRSRTPGIAPTRRKEPVESVLSPDRLDLRHSSTRPGSAARQARV